MNQIRKRTSRPQDEILQSQRKINLFLAGMGSGKTYLAGVLSYRFVYNYPKVKGFVGTNTYDQLNTSTLYRIKAVWDDLGVIEGKHYVCGKRPPGNFKTDGHHFDSYNNIISFINGAVIFQGSLENAKAHEGKEFAWSILDETKDTAEEDVKEVILMRLRESGMTTPDGLPWNPLYILTSPAKVPWINDWFKLDEYEAEIKLRCYSDTDYFVRRFENKKVVISSTYHNQVNLPANYIEDKRFDLSNEQFNRMIYGDPFMKTGGEFYSSFDRTKHVGRAELVDGFPLHISFDQNVVPYITAILCQVTKVDNAYQVYFFDEFCLPNPNNMTEKLCQHIQARYEKEMKWGVYFYGDASGKHRDTRGMANDYDIVERILRAYLNNSSNRVLHRNPALNKRRNFVNRIFEDKLPIKIVINPTCRNLVNDLEYIKETPEGTKHKQMVRDEKAGASYEKYGHTSDALDYFLVSCFKSYFEI